MADQIFYRFIKLDLTQFAIFDVGNNGDGVPVELSSSFRFAYSFKEEEVCCTTTVVVTKGTAPLLKGELNSYFKIQPDSVEAMTTGDGLVLPIGLMTQFASLGYGSMRGVLYVKTMGTPLESIVLPPNDLQKIFTSPVVFKE